MAGMLNTEAIGNLTRDPEVRYLPDGTPVTSFTIACNVTKEHVEFVRCSAWRKTGEIAAEYLRKGRIVYVAGRMTSRKYEAADGSTRFSLEMDVQTLQLIDSGKREDAEPAADPDDFDALPF